MVEKDPAMKRRVFDLAVAAGKAYAAAVREGGPSLVQRAQHALYERLVYGKLQARTGGRIRFFVSGGAALPRALGEFFESVGLLILEGYGLTESSPVIAVNRLGDHRYGTVGKAIPGVEVTIAPDGEILTRGPHVMRGYYNDPAATREAIDAEGWLHTGDIGVLDTDGYLHITDRKKHLFVSSGGKNIAPQPIESLFASNEYVDQFVLIGDRRMYLSALIVPDFEALRSYADAHGISYAHTTDLVRDPEINRLFDRIVQATQRDLANFEKVRRFTLLEQPFTIENGEVTPSLKIRRKTVEERYSDLIESMYRN
jgi:long-chain acyl-CoA synthetase